MHGCFWVVLVVSTSPPYAKAACQIWFPPIISTEKWSIRSISKFLIYFFKNQIQNQQTNISFKIGSSPTIGVDRFSLMWSFVTGQCFFSTSCWGFYNSCHKVTIQSSICLSLTVFVVAFIFTRVLWVTDIAVLILACAIIQDLELVAVRHCCNYFGRIFFLHSARKVFYYF